MTQYGNIIKSMLIRHQQSPVTIIWKQFIKDTGIIRLKITSKIAFKSPMSLHWALPFALTHEQIVFVITFGIDI